MHHAFVVKNQRQAFLARPQDNTERKLLGVSENHALQVYQTKRLFSDNEQIVLTDVVQPHGMFYLVEHDGMDGLQVFQDDDEMACAADSIDVSWITVHQHIAEIILAVVVKDGCLQPVASSLAQKDFTIVADRD